MRRPRRSFLRAGALALGLLFAPAVRAESMDLDLVRFEDLGLNLDQGQPVLSFTVVNPAESGGQLDALELTVAERREGGRRVTVGIPGLRVEPGTRSVFEVRIPEAADPPLYDLLREGAEAGGWPDDLRAFVDALQGTPMAASRELQLP